MSSGRRSVCAKPKKRQLEGHLDGGPPCGKTWLPQFNELAPTSLLILYQPQGPEQEDPADFGGVLLGG